MTKATLRKWKKGQWVSSFSLQEGGNSSREKSGRLQQVTTKRWKQEDSGEKQQVRESGEQRYLPQMGKKTVPPTVHSWDWTNQDQTAIFGQMARQCEDSKTTPLSWVGFRGKSIRIFLVYNEG